MKMFKAYILCLFISACANHDNPSGDSTADKVVNDRCKERYGACRIPFEFAIAHPQSLHNRHVRLSGFLVESNGSWLLYSHRVFVNEGISAGVFYLKGYAAKFKFVSGKVREVEGIFKNESDGARIAWATIEVTSMSPGTYRWPPFKEIEGPNNQPTEFKETQTR